MVESGLVTTGRKPKTGLKPQYGPVPYSIGAGHDGEKTQDGIETAMSIQSKCYNSRRHDGEKTQDGIETSSTTTKSTTPRVRHDGEKTQDGIETRPVR